MKMNSVHMSLPIHMFAQTNIIIMNWRRVYLVLSSPPATEETGAMDREIESRQGIGW
jgi:hypothetical protein